MKENKDVLDLGFALGQNHAFGLIAGRCSAAQAETLRRVREEKLYFKLNPVWKDFCPEYLGMSSAHADQVIRVLREFGPSYFALSQLTKISPEVYRAIAPAVKDGVLEHKGEIIELAPENAKKVAAAVSEMRREIQKKLPPPPPATPARAEPAADVDSRFDSLMRDLATIRDRQQLSDTLRTMMYRIGNLMIEQRC